nr:immunoglobulin light chain junction region [Macaca mulatta]MOW74620.1 immunoglobulin light chain junction region [Macaca mulatta]MOW74942.1 immunoglobulin light chain junction region [Macaca mulatta]
CQHTYGMPFTF